MTEAPLLVRHDALKAFTIAVLDRWGAPRAIAERTADLMIRTDLRGVDSHGIGMLPKYHEWYRECEQRRRRDGIPLAPGLVRQLRETAAAAGVPFSLAS